MGIMSQRGKYNTSLSKFVWSTTGFHTPKKRLRYRFAADKAYFWQKNGISARNVRVKPASNGHNAYRSYPNRPRWGAWHRSRPFCSDDEVQAHSRRLTLSGSLHWPIGKPAILDVLREKRGRATSEEQGFGGRERREESEPRWRWRRCENEARERDGPERERGKERSWKTK